MANPMNPRFSFNLVADLAAATTDEARAAIQAEIDRREARRQENEVVEAQARQFKPRKNRNWINDGGWPTWDGGI